MGFRADAPVSVVLEEDGTIVEDEAYFLCLPSNTKFMLLHDKDRWSAKTKGGCPGLLICLRKRLSHVCAARSLES